MPSMSLLILELLFWALLAAIVYTYAGYPIVIWCLARLFGRRQAPSPLDDHDLPSVSLLISAYNEEAGIEERLQNALALDYPKDRLEIVIASDGSTDRTAAIVRQYEDRGVRLLNYPVRRGKATVLNESMKHVKGEIVILSDANTATNPDAARNLVRWFRDDCIGAVCGRLILIDSQTGNNVDSLYWKYETFLKRCEGRLGALLGANGAIYAIPRQHYVPIPDGTIIDDFVIPLLARVKTGRMVVYDDQATATEETAPNVGSEFRRRARIGAGGFQSLMLLWPLLLPWRGWSAFVFVSHKICRWLCPFFLIGLLAVNGVLAHRAHFRWWLVAQLGFYTLAVAANWLPPGPRWLKPLRLSTMFVAMNVAVLVGFWRWLRGTQKGAWQRTPRVGEARAEVS